MQVGDLSASRDWGNACDYVKAMKAMLDTKQIDDMVIATGKLKSVRELLSIAAHAAGFEIEFEGEGVDEICRDKKSGLVLAEVSKKYFRKHDSLPKIGNISKIKNRCGWFPKISINETMHEMVEADIYRWRKGWTNV